VETADALASLRDVRTFAPRPLAGDDLRAILDAGRAAPSSQNWQPWDFVVVTDADDRRALARVWQGAGHVVGAAAAVALVAPIPRDQRQHDRVHYDLGQATMAMLLAAVDRGVASAHAGVADHDLARELLGHPEDRFCPYVLSFGYPPDGVRLHPLRRRRRRPYDEVVHVGRW